MDKDTEETVDPEVEKLKVMVRRKCFRCGHEVFYHAGPANENGMPNFNCRYDGCDCPFVLLPPESVLTGDT